VSYRAQAGDCGSYKGRVVGVPLDGGSHVIFYRPPTQRGGGIWNPAGPTVNAAGHLLVVSANGAAFPGDAYDHRGSGVYLPGTDGVRAVRADGSGQLHVLWHASDSITGSPVIGGGRIWPWATGAQCGQR
jgi:hypothetical protein